MSTLHRNSFYCGHFYKRRSFLLNTLAVSSSFQYPCNFLSSILIHFFNIFQMAAHNFFIRPFTILNRLYGIHKFYSVIVFSNYTYRILALNKIGMNMNIRSSKKGYWYPTLPIFR